VKNSPPTEEGTLEHWLVRNEKQNKSYAYTEEKPNSKKAILHYKLLARSDNYYLLEVTLKLADIIRYGVSWLKWVVLLKAI
jgi:23S rRNA pseudouridine1911/1915/1917 synthase